MGPLVFPLIVLVAAVALPVGTKRRDEAPPERSRTHPAEKDSRTACRS